MSFWKSFRPGSASINPSLSGRAYLQGDAMAKSIEKLTPEIIEACMDQESVEILERYDDEILRDVWAEMHAFNECVLSSDAIRSEMFGIARALYDPEAKGSDSPSRIVESLQQLMKAGKVTEWQLHLIEQVCRQFFFLGWHARGAVEEVEELNRMTE